MHCLLDMSLNPYLLLCLIAQYIYGCYRLFINHITYMYVFIIHIYLLPMLYCLFIIEKLINPE